MKKGQEGISRRANQVQRDWNNGLFGRTAKAPDAIIRIPRPQAPKASWWAEARTWDEFTARAAEREKHWKSTLPTRDLETEVW